MSELWQEERGFRNFAGAKGINLLLSWALKIVLSEAQI